MKVEKELNTTLPGTAEVTSGAQEDIEEQIIQIAESGEITLNDETMAGPNEKQMTLLKDTLKRLKQTCDAQKTPAVITILSEEKAKYSRTVDVLDALAFAQIRTVTFTTTEGEE